MTTRTQRWRLTTVSERSECSWWTTLPTATRPGCWGSPPDPSTTFGLGVTVTDNGGVVDAH